MPAERMILPLVWWKLLPALGVITVAVAVLIIMGPVFSTPQVGTTATQVLGPTAILSGLLIAFAVVGTLKEPVTILPRTGSRQVRAWRLARVLALLTLSVLMLTVAAPEHAPAAVSCACALSGEALLMARVLWEEIAWALPLLHAGLVLTFGTDTFGTPHPWAWILQPNPIPTALALSTGLLALGIGTWSRKPPA